MTDTPPPQNTYLTERELADRLRVTRRVLHRLRRAGKGPKFVRVNHYVVRYALADVIEWESAERTKG